MKRGNTNHAARKYVGHSGVTSTAICSRLRSQNLQQLWWQFSDGVVELLIFCKICLVDLNSSCKSSRFFCISDVDAVRILFLWLTISSSLAKYSFSSFNPCRSCNNSSFSDLKSFAAEWASFSSAQSSLHCRPCRDALKRLCFDWSKFGFCLADEMENSVSSDRPGMPSVGVILRRIPWRDLLRKSGATFSLNWSPNFFLTADFFLSIGGVKTSIFKDCLSMSKNRVAQGF